MDNYVLGCIQVRKDFFEKYYSVPAEVQPDVDAFIADMHTIGNECADAQEFEAKFAQNGLQDRLNSLVMRCTPKPYEMTSEEKASVKATARQMFEEDKSRIVRDAVDDTLDYASVMLNEEMLAQNRKAMIEADVFDDYTRASNAVDIAKEAGGFLKGLFKKKKQ